MVSFYKRYRFKGLLKLTSDLINTRLFFSKSRIVRQPYFIRGKSHIQFGSNLTTGIGLRIDADPAQQQDYCITLGNNVQLNDYVHIAAIDSVEIQDNVLIASKVFISDHNHGSYSGDTHSDPKIAPIDRPLYSKPVTIERNAWIGEFVSILPGVTIGEGSIIGSNSVVSKSVPPFSIAAGVPAKVIKTYNFQTEKWETLG